MTTTLCATSHVRFLAGDVTHTQTLGIVGNLVDLKTI